MASKTGQFKNDPKNEIAFVGIRSSETVNIVYTYVFEVSSDLIQIYIDASKRKVINLGMTLTPFIHLGLDAGDLNNDGGDEIVFSTINHIYTYATDDDLNLSRKVTGNVAEGDTYNDYKQSYNFIKVRDVNMDDREDVVIVKNFVQNQFADGFFIAMLSVNDNLDQMQAIGRLFGDEPQHDNIHPYSIAVGNFDGFNFTIGQPTHSTQNDVVQPIVILNAPPIHFDMFGSNIFDVNNCFNGGNCDFVATYKKQTTRSTEVSTKVSKDWAISSGVKAEGTIQGAPMGVGASVNYEAHLIG
ncbi:MAG: hypothetical protein GWN62_08770, partial [Aliifodinibius sp.]|nr:hypothetical protein [Fodinibius sp.]